MTSFYACGYCFEFLVCEKVNLKFKNSRVQKKARTFYNLPINIEVNNFSYVGNYERKDNKIVISRVLSRECRACFHCSINPKNWSLVESVLMKELVLSGRNIESLRWSLQMIDFHGSVCMNVYSFLW